MSLQPPTEGGSAPTPDLAPDVAPEVTGGERAGAALERLLTSLRRHFSEPSGPAAAAAEELLRRAVSHAEASKAQSLEAALRASLALAEMRLDPPTLAATILLSSPSASGAAAELSAVFGSTALGSEVASLVEGAARLARVRSGGTSSIHFGWAGSLDPGKPYYFRIQGATFLIEFDNSGGNHIHSVWRDFQGDFGRDVLAEHYAKAGGPGHSH